jgi:hypothetical protein
MGGFGIGGCGPDIPKIAIAAAQLRAKKKRWEFADKFQVTNSEYIPLGDGFFDVAKKVILEIETGSLAACFPQSYFLARGVVVSSLYWKKSGVNRYG